MSYLYKAIRLFRILLFAFMFAVCMVLGIAPIIPRRKDSFAIEIKAAENIQKHKAEEKVGTFKADG